MLFFGPRRAEAMPVLGKKASTSVAVLPTGVSEAMLSFGQRWSFHVARLKGASNPAHSSARRAADEPV